MPPEEFANQFWPISIKFMIPLQSDKSSLQISIQETKCIHLVDDLNREKEMNFSD